MKFLSLPNTDHRVFVTVTDAVFFIIHYQLHLLSTSSVSGTVMVLYVHCLAEQNFTAINHYLHFTQGDTEAQPAKATWPMSLCP